jgi:hypothetical protein
MQLELFAELPAVLAASALVDAPGRLFDELAAALKFLLGGIPLPGFFAADGH